MSRRRALFDRLVMFLLFLVFGGLGFWTIGLRLDVAAAQRIGEYVNRDFWAGLSTRDDYALLLVVAAVVTGLFGMVLVGVNIGRRRLGRGVSPASAPTGLIRMSPADIASAVARTFEGRDDVRAATSRAWEDRGTDILEIRLRVPAEADVADLREGCRRAAADIMDALPGQRVFPRFLLEAERPVTGT